MNTRLREVMLPVLMIPLVVPAVIGAVESTGDAFEGAGWARRSALDLRTYHFRRSIPGSRLSYIRARAGRIGIKYGTHYNCPISPTQVHLDGRSVRPDHRPDDHKYLLDFPLGPERGRSGQRSAPLLLPSTRGMGLPILPSSWCSYSASCTFGNAVPGGTGGLILPPSWA